jgi:NAD+ synthase
MVKAIGRENVVALWLPANSKESDKQDAITLANLYNVELKEFDLTNYANDYITDLKELNNVSDNDLVDASINLKPRLRMLTLYSYAAMMTSINKKGYLVIGTSNKSERFVGYFTKGGDGVCDIAPIADLYVDEVIKVGEYLGIPERIIHKTPDDGLSGVSDEEKLGFTYNDVKKVSEEIENNIPSLVNEEIKTRIINKHKANLHKFNIPYYKRTW